MPVKGLVTFCKNGERKSIYSHRNSFPASLGEKVVELCRNTSLEELSRIYDELIMVDEENKMTVEQIQAYKNYLPKEYWSEDLDWYMVLKYNNDIIIPIKEGVRHVVEYGSFLGSMRCRWIYIINIDSNKLEIYKNGLEKLGIMTDVDPAQYMTDDCLIPQLVGEFSLNKIPDNWIELISS